MTTKTTAQSTEPEIGKEMDVLKSPRSPRRAAMDCLARREHSFFELKQKLQTRLPEVDPAQLQRELERLREENLQSDRRFTEAFIRSRKSRGYGYTYIREALRRRFVAENLIDQYLFEDDVDWLEILQRLIGRRLTSDVMLQFGSHDHRRLYRFLERRGFSHTLIQKSISRFVAS